MSKALTLVILALGSETKRPVARSKKPGRVPPSPDPVSRAGRRQLNLRSMGKVLRASSDAVGWGEGLEVGLLDGVGFGDWVGDWLGDASAVGECDAVGEPEGVHAAASSANKTKMARVFNMLLVR